jgi:hypothetical protein
MWPMVELGTHLATERAGLVTLHLQVRAPQFYPDGAADKAASLMG